MAQPDTQAADAPRAALRPLPPLHLYNTLGRRTERFEPLSPGRVGLYVCGPTVYGEPHLGHARTAIVFDVLYRYLRAAGYQVRYVRNITDVGHLEQYDVEGGDIIAHRARLEQLEPMEIAQRYTLAYHREMNRLGLLPPSIEPRASGHISEQIAMCQTLLDRGLAYESNGSVYFDVAAYAAGHDYGSLSGRVVEELLEGTRELDGQSEKRARADFALWKRAAPGHIMRWPSPWGEGYPGWHIECSAMSAKYLGETFDIHGGGMDLIFPHHEAEIAQSTGCHGSAPARYWMHGNMVQINSQKMSKSLGNFITLEQCFAGDHPLLSQAYAPATVRFFTLQAHYRSTLDFSDQALAASQKGLRRLQNGLLVCERLRARRAHLAPHPEGHTYDEAAIATLEAAILAPWQALADDLNTALTIAALYELLRHMHRLWQEPAYDMALPAPLQERLIDTYREIMTDILGMGLPEEGTALAAPLRTALLERYRIARADKNWPEVDALRGAFRQAGLALQDGKTGSDWTYLEE